MAKLTKADAARQLHISRTTLYKLIDQGKLSATPDGMIDSAELVRVAPLVDSLKERSRTSMHTHAMDIDTSAYEHNTQPVDTVHEHVWTDVHRHEQTSTMQTLVNALREHMETMRHELQTAREERQAALQERQEAREERALLLHMLQQMQHRYDRLLEAPRPAPTVGLPTAPEVFPPRPPSPTAAEDVDRGTIRRRILALLQAHPEGLSTTEIRILLGMQRSLTDTCTGMLRDGLLQRVSRGRYSARPTC